MNNDGVLMCKPWRSQHDPAGISTNCRLFMTNGGEETRAEMRSPRPIFELTLPPGRTAELASARGLPENRTLAAVLTKPRQHAGLRACGKLISRVIRRPTSAREQTAHINASRSRPSIADHRSG